MAALQKTCGLGVLRIMCSTYMYVASIPPEQPYILFVDFNARVGSQSVAHDLQDGVWGPEGYGECNDAGSSYGHVSLPRKPQCAVHGSITSPFTNRLGSTQCQSTGIALGKDRILCLVMAVRRGAECHTDHQLPCVQIRMASGVYYMYMRVPHTR